MPITTNTNGVLYELTEVTTNTGGTLHALDTVHANVGGMLREIHSAWKFPVLGDWHTTKSTAVSHLNGDTYSVNVTGSAASDFTLTGRTKVTINITHYSSGGNIYSNVAEVRTGSFQNTYAHYPPTNGAYAVSAQTGQNSYSTFRELTAKFTLEKGNYYVGCSSTGTSGSNTTMEFSIKFEKA